MHVDLLAAAEIARVLGGDGDLTGLDRGPYKTNTLLLMFTVINPLQDATVQGAAANAGARCQVQHIAH